MSYTTPEFADSVIAALQADGYSLHCGDDEHAPCPEEQAAVFWFAWSQPGCDIEVGEDCETALGAWFKALAHRLANSRIQKQ